MSINGRKLKLSLAAVLAFTAFGAMAETANLAVEPFQETVRSAANTGGASVMGLQMTGADAGQDIHALLPTDWAGQRFCVRTVSSDGLYSSENTYVAPSVPAKTVEVPHVTLSSHPRRLSQLVSQNFGIRIANGDCTAWDDEKPAAVALWQSEQPAQMLEVYVNGFGAQRLITIAVIDGERMPPVECNLIDAEVRVAFDRLCQVPVNGETGAVSITLIPFKGGVRGRSETIEVLIQ